MECRVKFDTINPGTKYSSCLECGFRYVDENRYSEHKKYEDLKIKDRTVCKSCEAKLFNRYFRM